MSFQAGIESWRIETILRNTRSLERWRFRRRYIISVMSFECATGQTPNQFVEGKNFPAGIVAKANGRGYRDLRPRELRQRWIRIIAARIRARLWLRQQRRIREGLGTGPVVGSQ